MSKHFWKRVVAGALSLVTAAGSMLTNVTPAAAASQGDWPVVLKSKNPFDTLYHALQSVENCNANIMTVTIDGVEYMAYCMNPKEWGADYDNGNVGGSGYDVRVYDLTDPEVQQEAEILRALQGAVTYVLDPTPQTKLSDGETPLEFTFYNK